VRRLWVLAAMAAVGLLGYSALAGQEGGDQERTQRRRVRRDQGRQRMGRFGRGARGNFVMLNVPGLQAVEDLSDEQQKQIDEIRKALLAKIEEMKKQMAEDVKRVLTAEQAAKMEEAKKKAALRGPGGVTLTQEQKDKMDAAREAAGKIEDRQARMEFLRKAMEEIRATYTEEQKKQAEASRGRFRRTRGQGGRQRQPRPNPAGGTTE